MKVYVKGIWYDSTEEPVLLVLDDEEKQLIADMGDQTRFLTAPTSLKLSEMERLLRTEED